MGPPFDSVQLKYIIGDITVIFMGVIKCYKPTNITWGHHPAIMRWISSMPSWKHINFYLFGDCYVTRDKLQENVFASNHSGLHKTTWKDSDFNLSRCKAMTKLNGNVNIKTGIDFRYNFTMNSSDFHVKSPDATLNIGIQRTWYPFFIVRSS